MNSIARVVFAVSITLTSLAALVTDAAAQDRPNIIVIMCDDLGYSDISCFGGEINTPHLDRMAREGIRFTQFYNNAKCTETRASLMTGLYHQQTNNLRKRNGVTIAEALKPAGYTTLMSGKWHLGSYASGKPDNWDDADLPVRRGFDRYFGFLGGAINFFTGEDWASGKNLMRLGFAEYQVPRDFYSTDAFTDYAIRFIDEAITMRDPLRGGRKPFFLYLAHNAPHFPLQAPKENIARYEGRYDMGWDELRWQRFDRMRQLGVLRPSDKMSPRDPHVPAWDNIDNARRAKEAKLMEVYAGMVDRLDQNIGRLLAHIEKVDIADNTIVMFFSDNGACPYDQDRTPEVPPGPAESLRTYNSPWANASNTPLTLYKQWAHEGGVSTPFIVRWPKGIPANLNGTIQRDAAHVIDIMPTCLELAEADYPEKHKGHTIEPMQGQSLVSRFKGSRGGARTLFWEFRGHHAVREGDVKVVAESGGDWKFYFMLVDRSESKDLSQLNGSKIKKMSAMYDDWAKRVGARTHEECVKKGPVMQKR